MECLRKFELVSLIALIIEHIYKVVYIKEQNHGMAYRYFLNSVFNHFKTVCEKGTPGTVK